MKLRLDKTVILGIITTVAVAVLIIILCSIPSCGEKLDYTATFYYVCYQSPSDVHSASSISSAVHSYGGAGYIVEDGGNYYVTVSCYYSQRDAETVCATVNHKGLKCFVLKAEKDGYALSGSAKRYKEKYVGNLNTLMSLSHICYDVAISMDISTCDQDGAKSLLEGVKSGLDGLARQNASNCFSPEIKSLLAEYEDVTHGYIYSYDVRRLQIAIADSIIKIRLY